MSQPLVTIIIPSFNRADLINIALDSVISQTYQNWECLVVDDGSSDNTMQVLESYSIKDNRIKFFERNRTPKGASTCRNIGLQKSIGDYIVYLDSDDYLLPFCLKQRVNTISDNKDCDFLVFPMGKQKGGTIVKEVIPESDNYLIHFLSAVLPWSIMCPIWETSFLKQINGFTEGYPRFNDPELMIRALIEPQVTFKVCLNADFDTVYLPSPKEQFKFKDKVFDSLRLFIPDIVKQLEVDRKSNLKSYLALYLHLWFKFFYVPSAKYNVKQSILLIKLFKRQGVISLGKSMSLSLRLILFSISNLLLKRPINKLTDKALYLIT